MVKHGVLAMIATSLAMALAGCGRQGSAKPDPSTPQGAAVGLLNAIDRMDSAALSSAFSAEANPRLVGAMVRQLDAARNLRDAAVRSLGRDAARVAEGDAGPTALDRAGFASAQALEQGNGTVLLKAQGNRSMLLRKEGSAWKIVAYPHPSDERQVEEAAASMDALAQVIERTTEAVRTGKLKDIRSIRQSIGQGMVQALAQR